MPKNQTICLSAKTVELSETDERFTTMVQCLGYYDYPNLNGVKLPYEGCEEQAEEAAQSLLTMPVQAKYKKTFNGDDLGGHEVSYNEDGEMEFATESIGTHVRAWIEKQNVTTVDGKTMELPCLFAESHIWNRYPKMIAAIKRLSETDDGLKSSWEISTDEYVYADGIKTLTSYKFLSDCLLGSGVTAAYQGSSKAVSISEAEMLVAEALSQDMSSVLDTQNLAKEENQMHDEEQIVVSDGVVDTPEAGTNDEASAVEAETTVEETSNEEIASEEPEVASLTLIDIYEKLDAACSSKVSGWGYVAYVMPEEHYCLYKTYESAELDYLKFDYSVSENAIEISEPQNVTLTVSIGNINSYASANEENIASKDEAILKASQEIQSLKAEIAELTQYKEKFEVVEQERITQEIAQKKEELISYIVSSGQITREEIAESTEMSSYVDELNKQALMQIVAERLIASASTAKPEIETSSVETSAVSGSVNLNANDDDAPVDKVSAMRKYLGK